MEHRWDSLPFITEQRQPFVKLTVHGKHFLEKHPMKSCLRYNTTSIWALAIAGCLSISAFAVAEESYSTPELLAARKGTQWRVPVSADGPTRIPRVCASLKTAHFDGMPDKPVVVHPEIHYWELRFKGKAPASHIMLEFDSFPSTLTEAKPTEQAGDGTLTLRCSQGRTTGEKLRFEPQPHKNTIGYWAVAEDSVSWPITISQPGPFNVGLLQGAASNGGGIARISLLKDGKEIESIDDKIMSTGHFQNFRWHHAGTLTAKEPGEYSLRIKATKIDKAALMDVRQVHLSPKR